MNFLAPKLTQHGIAVGSLSMYLSQVPRRASLGSALNVARPGLNDGAQLWISFKHFPKQTFFTTHIRDLHNKGFV